jgi:4a-hydroxytetrahydrobiopterin dehydratase
VGLLSDSEIRERLTGLPGWAREGDAIAKRYEFASFIEAIDFVRRVADLAEAADHHPDIAVHYREVVLTLYTHSEGGITAKDIDAAKLFDEAIG